jgi:hypothetical protein
MSRYDSEGWQVYQEGAFPTEAEPEEERCAFCGEVPDGGVFNDGLRCKMFAEEDERREAHAEAREEARREAIADRRDAEEEW